MGGGLSAKTFDMRVVNKLENADHVFSAISKEEVAPISAFLQSKNVRLKNEMEDVMEIDPISEDDDEDEDDASIPSEDEKPSKGKDKVKKPSRQAANDDDESGTSPIFVTAISISDGAYELTTCSQRTRTLLDLLRMADHPPSQDQTMRPIRTQRQMLVIR